MGEIFSHQNCRLNFLFDGDEPEPAVVAERRNGARETVQGQMNSQGWRKERDGESGVMRRRPKINKK